MRTLLAVGTRKGLWLFEQRAEGRAWSATGPHFLMQEVPAVAWDGERLLVGVRSEHWGPTVATSGDLGASWQEPEHGAIRFPEDTGAALERVWQLAPDRARPGTVWAGCEPTSLWRSTDGGASFELVRGLWDHPHRPQWAPGAGGAAVHTVLPHPRDDDRVLVAMSTGGVYVTSDGGTSWNPSNRGVSASFMPGPEPEFGQCVHKVARDGVDPDRYYLQNHHGVYRSDDGGRTWTSIAEGLPSDFGFVVLAHPHRPDTVWTVPLEADGRRIPPGARLTVHRSDDAGASWCPCSRGLPERAWVSVLRDAAGVAAHDDGLATVAIGTRDGCVYVSHDDGERFEEVARHLPDVLAVRPLRLP
ncbi:MAG: WD40/YVTN/BNR-like repeat-containing protein [Actinomycetes bacterium]